jgi:integrase
MEHIIAAQIVPTFGGAPLASLRRSDVRGWVVDMTRDLAPTTVVSYYRCLAAIMKAAVDDGLIAKSPCVGIKLPRRAAASSALVLLDVAKVNDLADAMPERYRAAVLVQAGLGLRQGELCGLTVDRVDFLRSTVRIDRQLLDADEGAPVFGPPKTQASARVIPLPGSVRELLAAHIARFQTGEDGLIFTTAASQPLRRSTYSRLFRRATANAGIGATSHDLRH